jgi:tetratricopeptide (TPR) repeat protein
MPSRNQALLKISRFYLVRLQMIEAMFTLDKEDRLASLAGFTVELENIRAHIRELNQMHNETGDPESANLCMSMLDAGTETIARFLPLEEQKEWHEMALHLAQVTGNTKAEKRFLHNLALICSSMGEQSRAITLQMQCLKLAKKLGDPRETAKVLNSLGNLYVQSDQLELAKKCYDEFFAINIDPIDLKELAYAIGNVGIIYHRAGDWSDAHDAYQYNLEISRKMKDRNSECRALCQIGDLHFDLRRYPRAREYYEMALAIAKEEMDLTLLDSVMQGLGNISFVQKKYPEARSYYERCYQNAKGSGSLPGQAVALGNIGNIFFKLCLFDIALTYYERQLNIAQMIANKSQIAGACLNIGLAHLNQNQMTLATEYLSRSAALFDDIGIPYPIFLYVGLRRISRPQSWVVLQVSGLYFKICQFLNRKYREA